LCDIAGKLQNKNTKAQKIAQLLLSSKDPHVVDNMFEMMKEIEEVSHRGQKSKVHKLLQSWVLPKRIQRQAVQGPWWRLLGRVGGFLPFLKRLKERQVEKFYIPCKSVENDQKIFCLVTSCAERLIC
jgi:hypothetical protein